METFFRTFAVLSTTAELLIRYYGNYSLRKCRPIYDRTAQDPDNSEIIALLRISKDPTKWLLDYLSMYSIRGVFYKLLITLKLINVCKLNYVHV